MAEGWLIGSIICPGGFSGGYLGICSFHPAEIPGMDEAITGKLVNQRHSHMSTKGYLPHHFIKGFVFWILSICLAAATVSGILFRWGAIGEVVAGRCLWTAFILSLGSVAFLIVNYLFGALGSMLFGQGSSSPRVDPAFAERLKAAKTAGQPRQDLSGTDHTTR